MERGMSSWLGARDSRVSGDT